MKSIRKVYFKYLLASLGGSLILSIYSLVDAICIGQYHGEAGTAALALVFPLWTIIFSLGFLFGIGGASLYSNDLGRGMKKEALEKYTISSIGVLICSLVVWILLIFFDKELIYLFGGRDPLIVELALNYVSLMKITLPCFTLNQFLAAFIRNDQDPNLTTYAVIAGGLINIILDISFVFLLDMGIKGAGLATALGQFVTFFVMCLHFIKKNNSLKFVKISHYFNITSKIIISGFSVFIVDIAMGVFTILFNNQIVFYLGTSNEATATLAIYSVIANVLSLVQSFAYGIGQASQPLISISHGKNNQKEVNQLFHLGLLSATVLGIVAFLFCEIFPLFILKRFTDTSSSQVIELLAPKLMRFYFSCFLILPINVYFTYFFQSILKPRDSFILTILRGIVFSGILLYILPKVFDFDYMFLTMPITEVLVLFVGICFILLQKKEIKYL